MKGFRIRREIFASLPAIDGRLADMTQKERDDYIKMLFNNTKEVMKWGVLLPIKEHEIKNDEILHGKIVDIRLRYKKKPTPHFTIEGELLLDKEYYDLYNEEKLPGASVEIDPKGANLMAYTGKDTHVGEYIYAVALCGKTPVAMPQLAHVQSEEPLYNMYSLQTRLLSEARSNNNYDKKNPKEEPPMDKLDKIMEIIREGLTKLFPADADPNAGEDPEEKEKPEMGAEAEKKKKEEEEEMAAEADAKDYGAEANEKIASLEKEMAEMKGDSIDGEYKALAAAGKVLPEQKEQFTKIAKTQGLKFAREVYNSKTAAVPQGEVIPGQKDKPDKSENEKKNRHFKLMKRFNPTWSKETLEESWTMTKEKVQAREDKSA